MVAPMPGFRLLADRFGKQLLAGHLHRRRKIDGACNEFVAVDRAAIGKFHASSAPILDDDFLHIGAGDDFATAGLHNPRQRKRQGSRTADRQSEARDIGENRREYDACAGHVLGRDDVHIRRE